MKKGDRFRLTYSVTPYIYRQFRKVFKDDNPLHTNKKTANRLGFDNIVMHGNILNGFISNFVGIGLPVKNVAIISQNINFIKPVYLNDKLLFEAVVNEYFESVSTVEFSFAFSNQKKEKVARGTIQAKVLTVSVR